MESSNDEILVLAPTGKDGVLVCDVLRKKNLLCRTCPDIEALAVALSQPWGALLVSEEALVGVDIRPIVERIERQEPWSDLPIILLAPAGAEPSEAGTRVLAILGARANVTIIERPVRIATLLSAVLSALRARRREYQVRDYLLERERAEIKSRETQKLESLGVLAGGVAHDFNNLLTGILGNASLALDTLDSGEPIGAMLTNVVEAAERAADLTRQLLAYAGKGGFRVEPVDLSDAVRTIARLVSTSIPKGVRVVFDLGFNLPLIRADLIQLQQIAMNLIINGAESIDNVRGGALRVKTYIRDLAGDLIGNAVGGEPIPAGRYVVMEVEDTGCGMSRETLSRIFDPFFTTKFLGRGLGLAAVLGIVRSHRGALEVDTREGRGTTFRVFLPAAEAATSSHTPDEDESILPIPGRGPG